MNKALKSLRNTLRVIFYITLMLVTVVSGLVALVMVPITAFALLIALGDDFRGFNWAFAAIAPGSVLLTIGLYRFLSTPAKGTEQAKEERRPGGPKRHVYMVSGRGLIKIGIATCPDTRLRKHASQGLTQVHATHEFDSEWEARALEDDWKEHITPVRSDVLRDGFTEASFATTAAWTHAQETWLEHTGKTVPIPFSRKA